LGSFRLCSLYTLYILWYCIHFYFFDFGHYTKVWVSHREWRSNDCHVRSRIYLTIVKTSSRVCFLGTCHICWVAHRCGFCFEVDFNSRDLWDYLKTHMWSSHKDPYNKLGCLHLLGHKEGACIFLLYISHPWNHINFFKYKYFLTLSFSFMVMPTCSFCFFLNNVHLSLFFLSWYHCMHIHTLSYFLFQAFTSQFFFIVFITYFFFILFTFILFYLFIFFSFHHIHAYIVNCSRALESRELCTQIWDQSSHFVSKKNYLC